MAVQYYSAKESQLYPLISTVTSIEAGLAMVLSADPTTNLLAVNKSAGTLGEKFVGFSYFPQATINTVAKIETVVVPDATTPTYVLKAIPLAGTIFVKDLTTNAPLTVQATAPTDNTEVQLVGNVLTFFGGTAPNSIGDNIYITYTANATTADIVSLVGSGLVGISPVLYTNSISVMTRGDMSLLNNYDTSVDWTGNITVYTAANGNITTKTGGTAIPVTVLAAPSVGGALKIRVLI